MNILFATTVLPQQQTTGGEIASQNFIGAMRQAGHLVSVFGFARPGMDVPAGSTAVDCRPIETRATPWFAIQKLGAALRNGRPYICEKFYAPDYVRLMRAAAGVEKADVLVIDHAQMGWLLPVVKGLAHRLVFTAHNHEAALYAEQASQHRNPLVRAMLRRDAKLIGEVETQIARAADQIWTLSAHERQIFDKLAGAAKFVVMPLPGRIATAEVEPIAKTVDIALLGTWAWPVNGRGLDWFVDQVLPFLPEGITIKVGGRGSERVNGRRDTLAGIGLVDDATLFLRAARVVAVPSVIGAGIQLKTIEAVALGLPTVSTSIGLRGIDPVPAYVRAADEPQDFARALVVALSEGQDNGKAGRLWAQRRHDVFQNAVASGLERPDANLAMAEA